MNITQWTYQLYQLCTVYPWVSIKRYWIQLYNVRCIQERNNTFSKDTGTITCKCFSNLTSNYTAVIIISCTAQPWSVPQLYRITRYVTDVLLNTIDSWRSGNVSTSVKWLWFNGSIAKVNDSINRNEWPLQLRYNKTLEKLKSPKMDLMKRLMTEERCWHTECRSAPRWHEEKGSHIIPAS